MRPSSAAPLLGVAAGRGSSPATCVAETTPLHESFNASCQGDGPCVLKASIPLAPRHSFAGPRALYCTLTQCTCSLQTSLAASPPLTACPSLALQAIYQCIPPRYTSAPNPASKQLISTARRPAA